MPIGANISASALTLKRRIAERMMYTFFSPTGSRTHSDPPAYPSMNPIRDKLLPLNGFIVPPLEREVHSYIDAPVREMSHIY